MSVISPFHATPDDLSDLDRKTAQGLEPLLDQLNVVMRQLVGAVNSQPTSKTYDTTFVSESSGSAYVKLTPPVTKPTSVYVDQLALNDGTDILSPWSFSWVIIGSGVRILFIGLDMDTKYNLRVTIK